MDAAAAARYSHLVPTDALQALLSAHNGDPVDAADPIMEARLVLPAAAAGGAGPADEAGAGYSFEAWREIVSFLGDDIDERGVYAWLTPNLLLQKIEAFESDDVAGSNVDVALTGSGAGWLDAWFLELESKSSNLVLKLWAREQLVGDNERQALGAIFQGLSSDGTFHSVRLFGVLPLPQESLRALVSAAPGCRRNLGLYEGRNFSFTDEQKQTIVEHCHEELRLCCDVSSLGHRLAQVLIENRGPRKLTLRVHDESDADAYNAFLAALSSNAVIRELYFLDFNDERRGLNKELVRLLVEALPNTRGLVTLGLPSVHGSFSIAEWRALWSAVGAHPTLQKVTCTGGRLETDDAIFGLRVTSSRIMAQCLRNSTTLTEICHLQPPDYMLSYSPEAFQAEVEPILFGNRHRRDVKRIQTEGSAKIREFLVASALTHPRARRLPTLAYPVVRGSFAAVAAIDDLSEPPVEPPRQEPPGELLRQGSLEDRLLRSNVSAFDGLPDLPQELPRRKSLVFRAVRGVKRILYLKSDRAELTELRSRVTAQEQRIEELLRVQAKQEADIRSARAAQA
jgi:hypothetical protein